MRSRLALDVGAPSRRSPWLSRSRRAPRTRRARPHEPATSTTEPGECGALQRFRMRNWSAPNDHTLIIVAYDGTRYQARKRWARASGSTFANAAGVLESRRLQADRSVLERGAAGWHALPVPVLQTRWLAGDAKRSTATKSGDAKSRADDGREGRARSRARRRAASAAEASSSGERCCPAAGARRHPDRPSAVCVAPSVRLQRSRWDCGSRAACPRPLSMLSLRVESAEIATDRKTRRERAP